jgi:phosphinothricin acetyltransferase
LSPIKPTISPRPTLGPFVPFTITSERSIVAIVKNGYATEIAGVRRDLQDDKRCKYDELPPVQLLEKSVFTPVIIRRAELADAEPISEIYNEAILTTTATFDTEPKDVAERIEWLKSHDDRHPVLVALSQNKIVGWSALSRWSERRAYDDTAETSFYVRSDFRGHGIGRKLKEATIEEARRLGFHTLIARVAEGSKESLHLNASMGFFHVGTLKEVGRKFDRLIDVHILQKMLRPTR